MSLANPTLAVAAEEFREAMSREPGAVHLVTTDGEAGRRGLTVTSTCSVSDDPPTMLVCLNIGNPLNERFESNGCFAVNLLRETDEELARAFAGQGGLAPEERFDLARWDGGATGAPLLNSAIFAFDCRLVESQTVATHRILIGEVMEVRIGPKGRALLYLDRTFRSL